MRSVLIVDDDVAVAQSLAMALEADGFHPTLASGARKARQLLLERDFDCILTDWRMPGEDGLRFVSGLADKGGMPPAILMSAHISADMVGAAMAAGCVDVLPKPIDFVRLQETIRRLADPPGPLPAQPRNNEAGGWDDNDPFGQFALVDPKAETEPSLSPVSEPIEALVATIPVQTPPSSSDSRGLTNRSLRVRSRQRTSRKKATALSALAFTAITLATVLVFSLVVALSGSS
jgi:DNA-binding response OmpR family regulator